MLDVVDKVVRQNPCLECPGYCCWQNIINLCSYDVWAIAANLHVKLTDFVAFTDPVKS